MRNIVLWSVTAAILILLLYNVKYNTHHTQSQTKKLELALMEERAKLHMAQLEWARVSRPERIQHLVRQHLPLQPIATTQLHSSQSGHIIRVKDHYTTKQHNQP